MTQTSEMPVPATETRSMDIDAIMKKLPHRYPFLMLDRVLEVEPGKRGVAFKNVTSNEPHFLGHFPGNPIMPGVLIVEAMAQLGGLVTSLGAHPDGTMPLGFLAAIDKVKFRRMVRPGDELRLEVEVISAKKQLGKIHGRATVDGDVAAEGDILFVFDQNGAG